MEINLTDPDSVFSSIKKLVNTLETGTYSPPVPGEVRVPPHPGDIWMYKGKEHVVSQNPLSLIPGLDANVREWVNLDTYMTPSLATFVRRGRCKANILTTDGRLPFMQVGTDGSLPLCQEPDGHTEHGAAGPCTKTWRPRISQTDNQLIAKIAWGTVCAYDKARGYIFNEAEHLDLSSGKFALKTELARYVLSLSLGDNLFGGRLTSTIGKERCKVFAAAVTGLVSVWE